jgi:hypothetical protein
MDNNDPFRARHYDEFLAEQLALETIEAAGIEVPAWLRFQSIFYIQALIERDEAEGLFIDPRAAEYAGYKPKAYVFDQEKLLRQYQEQLAEPRISESEVERIRAIREEYRRKEGKA